MNIFLFLITLTLTSLFAQQDQQVSGKWAYYGDEFYAALSGKKAFDRPLFSRILNGMHSSTSGKLDIVGTECVKGTACYAQEVVGYDRARLIMFGDLDVKQDGDGLYVIDVYCGKKFTYRSPEDVSRMGDQVNIEHTWPQSRFNGSYSKEMQKSDLHHLYPADSHANSVRGNLPFGVIAAGKDVLGGEGCEASRFGLAEINIDVYTPPTGHRGNVARALFYFSMHYDLRIDPAQEQILRQWHKNDPVDAEELLRHKKIATYQKIRNPFVDHPEIVEKILDF